jgi:hypothetical protein
MLSPPHASTLSCFDLDIKLPDANRRQFVNLDVIVAIATSMVGGAKNHFDPLGDTGK